MSIKVPVNATFSIETGHTRQFSPKLKGRPGRRSVYPVEEEDALFWVPGMDPA
jgi:hypothetical protein